MKKILLGMLLSSASLSAVATDNLADNHWVAGVGYTNLSDDEDGLDISLGAIVASLGYKIKSSDNFFITPEVRLGTGITDDTIAIFGSRLDIELERLVALTVRGEFEFDNGFYLYAAPSYTNVRLKASGYGRDVSEDSWEFGIGGGLGYQFTQKTAAEVSYEQFDGADVLSFSVKFAF